MGEPENSRNLLAHLSWRFQTGIEELAVEALAYILNRYPDSRDGLDELLKRAVPDMKLSAERFETEVSAPDGTRPDVLQKGDDGRECFFIEAKFYASLTPNQPVPYLKRLPEKGISVLMFLAPSGRVEELWPELLGRLTRSGMRHSESDVGSRCVAIDGTGKHLLITDWTKLLDSMEKRLEDSGSGIAELRQLRGLVRFAESGGRRARRPGEALVRRVTEIGKASGWMDTRGLNVTPRPYGFGRYALLGHRYKICVWLGVNSTLDEEFGCRHLWVHCAIWETDNRLGNERVRSALKDHVKPHFKQADEELWVAVVPEGDKGVDGYATALERIAGALDELADPWGSRADVLAEVIRRYERPVMSNTHRAEFVEALVALALRDSGWTPKAPGEAWHFEKESGVRLKLRHSVAEQSWGNGEIQSSSRFNITPGSVESRGRLVPIYVFAWHGDTGESADQGDPRSWEFYVVAEPNLPEEKTIALEALKGLASQCGIEGLAAAVEATSEFRL